MKLQGIVVESKNIRNAFTVNRTIKKLEEITKQMRENTEKNSLA